VLARFEQLENPLTDVGSRNPVSSRDGDSSMRATAPRAP
jgi:hypothetical protein